MSLAIGSTASLQSLQDPTGAPPSQPRTSPSAAENVAQSNQDAPKAEARAVQPQAEPEAARSEDLPPPPAESGRGRNLDLAA